MLKYTKYLLGLLLIICLVVNNNLRGDSTILKRQSQAFKGVYIMDTINLKGCYVIYGNRKSNHSQLRLLKIFIPDKEVKDIKKRNIKNLLKDGYVYLHPTDFMGLLNHPEKLQYLNLCNKDTSSKIVYTKAGSRRILSGAMSYYTVEAKFLVSLVDVNVYKNKFWTRNSWFKENSYLKVLVPLDLKLKVVQ